MKWQLTLILVYALSVQSKASSSEMPLTTKSFQIWLTSVCTSSKCTRINPQQLSPHFTLQLPPDAQAFQVTQGKQSFYLLHNVGIWQGKTDMQEITFYPKSIGTTWTPESMRTVAGWLTQLAGGQLSALTMQNCVSVLKRFGYPADTFRNERNVNPLGLLRVDAENTVSGGCSWLPQQRNVAFGFTAKGKF